MLSKHIQSLQVQYAVPESKKSALVLFGRPMPRRGISWAPRAGCAYPNASAEAAPVHWPVEAAAAVGTSAAAVEASKATGCAATMLIYAVRANMQHCESHPKLHQCFLRHFTHNMLQP